MSFNTLSNFLAPFTNPPQMSPERREQELNLGLFTGGCLTLLSLMPLYGMSKEDADPLERISWVAIEAIIYSMAYAAGTRWGNVRHQQPVNHMPLPAIPLPIPVDDENEINERYGELLIKARDFFCLERNERAAFLEQHADFQEFLNRATGQGIAVEFSAIGRFIVDERLHEINHG